MWFASFARTSLFAALLAGCGQQALVSPPRTRVIATSRSYCSAVVLDDCTVVTAAHCYEPGAIGAVVVAVGDAVEAEGWGCGIERAGWYVRARAMRRRATITAINRMLIGYELELSVPLCHGDSGGGLWDSRGRLIGILTGTGREHGYATPWPR